MADSAKKKKTSSAGNSFVAFFEKPAMRIIMKSLGTLSKCFLTIMSVAVITVTVVGCVLSLLFLTSFNPSENLPTLGDVSEYKTSVIYTTNSDGQEVEYKVVKGAKRVWADIETIPDHLQKAVISIEDERFETHKGVDWKRTISAMLNMVFRFNDQGYGGSTITQQLIKNLLDDNDVSVSRKVREIFRALEMEKNYADKSDILEAYLNILPLSSNVVGVGAAAKYYFAKEVSELTLAECAIIAGITQNPSKFDPYLHPQNIKSRQITVLEKMHELGHISEDEYIQAANEEIVYKPGSFFDINGWYDDLLINQVIQALVDTCGYTEKWATHILYFGGLRIYSALDLELQQKVEAIYKNNANFPAHLSSDASNVDPQGAILVLDYSGKVIATVGGRGEKEADRTFNRSTDAKRQPGSAMKPIAVYAQAVQNNLITYSTLLRDERFMYDGIMWPPNYGQSGSGYGSGAWYPAEYMLARSFNTAAAGLIMKLTPQKSFDFLTQKLHMTTLVDSRIVGKQVFTDKIPSLSLGGVTDGVKCIEMAAAYQIFGNGGKYNSPWTFYRIERDNDFGESEIIVQHVPEREQAIDADTSYVMNRMLQLVTNYTYGTAGGVGKINGSTTFAKTGTTDFQKDVYFAGGTPYYVAASWFGYDLPKKMANSQSDYARSLWVKVMNALHQGLPGKDFDSLKADTVELKFCRSTGNIAVSGCPDVSTGVYKKDFIPANCSKH